MRNHIIIIGLLVSVFSNLSFAQNEVDVVRYLSTDFSGTARVASMAGAFGSLGGDISTPLINPSGSAIYLTSDVELTAGASFYNSDVDIMNQKFSNGDGRVIFSNFGYVHSSNTKRSNSTYINFSMGYFRTKDFKFNSNSDIFNNKSSMLFDFTGQAQGIPVEELPNESPFYSNLAWDTYLIDEDTLGSSSYITQPRYEEYFSGVDQRNVVDENGSMGEMYFNSAIAIQQKIFIGVTLGFVAGTYSKKTSFTEQTTNDSLLLDYHVFVYEQESDINGINLKLGVIYKPQDWLRLGLAYHLPYKIHIVDNWFTTLRSQFKDGDFYSEKSPDGRIDYEIKNPGKLIFSAALISGFRGLLSMDAEWIDYSKSKII